MKNQFIAHVRKNDKQPQFLWQHLEEVSSFAGQFAKKIGLKDLGNLIGMLHDLGKASKEFDTYIKSAVGLIDPDQDEYVDAAERKGKVDHSSAGAQTIFRKLSDKGTEGILTAQFLSICIASHHSGMIDCLLPDGHNNFQRRMEKLDLKTHTEEAWSNLDDSERERIENLFSKELSTELFTKLKSLKEENDSKETLMFKYGLLTRFLFSCLIDADRLSTADFEFPHNKTIRNQNLYPSWDKLIERFNRKKFENKNEVDVLRSRISQACLEFSIKPKGLYQLTVPTGGGKLSPVYDSVCIMQSNMKWIGSFMLFPTRLSSIKMQKRSERSWRTMMTKEK